MDKNYEKYLSLYGADYERQLTLENSAKVEAENILRKSLERARQEHEPGDSKIASRLMSYTYDTCRTNITALIELACKPRNTTQGTWLEPMQDLLTIYKQDELEDKIVLIGLSTILNNVITLDKDGSAVDISTIAHGIGKGLKDEADVDRYLQGCENVKASTASLDAGIKKRIWASYRIAYAKNRMNKENYTGLSWSKAQVEGLGAKVLEMLISGSDYFEIVKDTKKGLSSVKPTEWLMKTWNAQEENMISRAVRYLPTLIPPRPWTSPQEGGYYGASMIGTQLIRLHYVSNSWTKAYNKKLNSVGLDTIFTALNAMQDTPFKINQRILDVALAIYKQGGDWGGLPRTEPYDTLPRLPETASPEELKEHKKKAAGLYKKEASRKTKALRCLLSLKTAERFKDEPRIYFPWNIDYRGRCYPIPTALHPQGDDVQKALLYFAEPTPIKPEDVKWLKIHGANVAGLDKKTFDERTSWIEANNLNIIASAEDPLGYRWWWDVSKDESPLEFLAFCFEWADFKEYERKNGTAEGFESGLPIGFDGTCSGLQHYSGLLRDEIGGRAVNLAPSDKVQDIYGLVAEKVNAQLMQDAQTGTADTTTEKEDGKTKMKYGTKTLARNWVAYNREQFNQDGITRKVCKRSVMTLAYGSKKYGFKQNLLTDILEPYQLTNPEQTAFLDIFQAAGYMADLIWQGVRTTVVKAVEGMEWLRKVAKLVCKNGYVVSWTTPNGLPVQQNYVVNNSRAIQVRFNHARLRLYYQEDSDKIDSRKQVNGVAPNFIHSMDATHLQRVVIAEKAQGNKNFMMIHDDFGTDVAHAGHMYHAIREEFMKLYSDTNYLEAFLNDVSYMIADEDKANIPPLPDFGKLELEQVKQSKYCFA